MTTTGKHRRQPAWIAAQHQARIAPEFILHQLRGTGQCTCAVALQLVQVHRTDPAFLPPCIRHAVQHDPRMSYAPTVTRLNR